MDHHPLNIWLSLKGFNVSAAFGEGTLSNKSEQETLDKPQQR